MGIVTTHTEGRVVVHSGDESRPVEVVQLPARDAAIAAANPFPPTKSGAEPVLPRVVPPVATPAVKAAVKQQKARERKATKK